MPDPELSDAEKASFWKDGEATSLDLEHRFVVYYVPQGLNQLGGGLVNNIQYQYISSNLIHRIFYLAFLALSLFLITAQYTYSQNKKTKNIQKPAPQFYFKPTVGIYSQYVDPNLANMVKQGKKEIYRIYVIPNNTNYLNVEKKYWDGLIAMPNLQAPANIRKDIDGLGNSTTQFYYNNQTKQLNRMSSNFRGNVYKVDTINPDGSISTQVDLTQNKIADYIETTFPNGRTIIAVNELKGLGFLDGQLSGRNAWCDYSNIFNRPKSPLPGCETSTSSASGGGAYGVAPGAGSSPLDSFMNNMCSGVKRSKPGKWGGRNYSQETVIRPPSVHTEVGPTGLVTITTSYETKAPMGGRYLYVIRNLYTTGGALIQSETDITEVDSRNRRVETTVHTVRADGQVRTVTIDASGNAEVYDDKPGAEKPKELEKIGSGPDKSHPGRDPLPDDQTGLSIVCNNWFNSKDQKPGSISELDSKSRADCNPYAKTANETATGSVPSKKQYLDNCYAGLEGSRNIMELVGISEASNANCGPYEDPGPDGKCKGNRIKQIKNGALINGAGIQAVEICNPLLCQGPPEH